MPALEFDPAVAVIVTVAGFGIMAGAEYTPSVPFGPAVIIVPTVEFPPTTPLTAHVTAALTEPVMANVCF